jgi:hypothetical protein
MKIISNIAFVVIFASFPINSVRGEDSIAKVLDLAKEKFDAESAEIDAMVLKWFDEQETRARKTGNKEAVDKLLSDREKFASKNEIPDNVPAPIVRRRTQSKQKLVFAFEKAISDYVKQKDDLLASRTQDDLKAFKEMPSAIDSRKIWRYPKGQFRALQNGEWEEELVDGRKYRYKETTRTKEFVELDALNGDTSIRVRIFGDRCDYGKKPSLTFTTVHNGTWAKELGRTK